MRSPQTMDFNNSVVWACLGSQVRVTGKRCADKLSGDVIAYYIRSGRLRRAVTVIGRHGKYVPKISECLTVRKSVYF
jgi:hypothetical protein